MALSVTYVVHLTDPVAYAAALALFPGGVIPPYQRPVDMAYLLGAPLASGPSGGTYPPTTSLTYPATVYTYDTVTWGFPTLNPNVAFGTLNDPPWNANGPVDWYWTGVILFVGTSPAAGAPPPATRIGTRRWAVGFEIPEGGEGNSLATQSLSGFFGRVASRTSDGLGLAIRQSSAANLISLQPNNPHSSWERFYLRLRRLPTQDCRWWYTLNGVEAGAALYMQVTSAGRTLWKNQGNAGSPTLLLTTAPLTLHRWYRFDVWHKYRSASLEVGYPGPDAPVPGGLDTRGQFALFLNGVCLTRFGGALDFINVETPANSGLAAVGTHQRSQVGTALVAGVGIELDFDDWINATYLDVTVGSHVQLVRPVSLLSAGGWSTPSYQRANSLHDSDSTARMTSVTANDPLVVGSDYADVQQGCVGITVAAHYPNTPAGNRVGLDKGSGVTLLTSPAQINNWVGGFQTQSAGLATPAPIASVALTAQKANNVTSTDLNGLFAEAEYHGYFGEEDGPVGLPVVAPTLNLHNAPYPQRGVPRGVPSTVAGHVALRSFTYVGNGTAQTIPIGIVPHFVFVRPITGAAATGTIWWSSMTVAHAYHGTQTTDNQLSQVRAATVGLNGLFDLSGSTNTYNAAGVTYRVFAFSDPASRFLLNGAFSVNNGGSAHAAEAQALVDPTFTPRGVMLHPESLGVVAPAWAFSGPGNAANNGTTLSNGAQVAGISFGAGFLTPLPSAYGTPDGQTAFACWRTIDSLGVGQVLDIVTWTGNGVGTDRDIAVDLGGRTPFWTLASPRTAVAIVRDPSHTGNNSSTLTAAGTNITTGIRSVGPNRVTVGTSLNVNGTVYQLLTFADVTGGVDGAIGIPVVSDSPAVVPTIGQGCSSGLVVPTAGGGSGCRATLDPTVAGGGEGCSADLTSS